MVWHRRVCLAISAAGVVSIQPLVTFSRGRQQSSVKGQHGTAWYKPVLAETHPNIPKNQPQDMKKIVVLVDMDNTIADFDEHALSLLRERHGSPFHRVLPSLTQFPLAANFPGHEQTVMSLLHEENFFRSFKPIPGAI